MFFLLRFVNLNMTNCNSPNYPFCQQRTKSEIKVLVFGNGTTWRCCKSSLYQSLFLYKEDSKMFLDLFFKNESDKSRFGRTLKTELLINAKLKFNFKLKP